MRFFKEKFILFFIPFLITDILFISGYTTVHGWWQPLSHLPPQVADLILPLLLPILPVWLVYRRRAMLVRFGNRYSDGFMFQVGVWAAIAVPAVLAQLPLEAASGRLSRLVDLGATFNQLFSPEMAYGWYLAGAAALAGIAFVLFATVIVRIDEWDLVRYRKGYPLTRASDTNLLTAFFIPKGDLFVSAIILDLNILVFAAMVFCGLGFTHFATTDLLHWGGNLRPAVADGQWWRLLTSTFLHGGVSHLASNMVSLIFVAALVEPIIGRWRFGIVYLLTGIIASLASLWAHEATVSVGASGAIFGLYGVFVALMIAKVFPKGFRRQFLRMTLIFIIYNLAMGFSGNIDNAAHLGGLLSGIVAGLALAPGIKRAKKRIQLVNISPSPSLQEQEYY